MNNLFSLRNKEVPEELQRTEKIFDTKLNQLEKISDKFLIAEKNAIPYYLQITSNNLLNSNNNYVCFIDLGENSMMTHKSVDLRENSDEKSVFSRLTKVITDSSQWRKFKEFFTIESNSLKDINNLNEIEKNELLEAKEIKNMKINAIGNTIASNYKKNSLMILNIETKKTKLFNFKSINNYLENSDTLASNEIVDIEWHPVNRNDLACILKKRIIFLRVSEELDIIHERTLKFDGVTKFKWDPSGKYSICISNNDSKFNLIDSDYKILYSKKYFSFSFGYKGVTWANDSSYFILYSKSSIYLYNTLNLSFKSWNDFKGDINNVIISNNSDYILIFTDDESNPMYILYNIEEDFYNFSNYSSYNNISRYFSHWNFQVAYKNFSFYFSDKNVIVKSRLNENNNRLAILYKNSESSKYELQVFGIEFCNSIHEIKIYPIFSLYEFRDLKLIDFELYYNYYDKEDVLIILWDGNGKYLSKTYLNANDLKIN